MSGTLPSYEVLQSFERAPIVRIGFTLQEVMAQTHLTEAQLRRLRGIGRLPIVWVTPRRLIVLAGDLGALTGDPGLTLDDAFPGQRFLTVRQLVHTTGISTHTWDRIIQRGDLKMIRTDPRSTRICWRDVFLDYLRERRVA